MRDGLEAFNSLSEREAERELLKCCGSTRWAQRVAEARPFDEPEELLRVSDRVWWSLDEADWLEAFRHHPKIGERKASVSQTAQAQGWSEAEQAGVQRAARETLDALAQANLEYEKRFGYIFIICATGKSSEEMLSLCRERLEHEAERELSVAAEEQRRITQLRLKKLLTNNSDA